MNSDQAKRKLALNPKQSFIVQAPAGSGKTELLIQRFLVLLARVSFPEEVVAITFTRKAASEMRERILSALENASKSCPLEAHAAKTWDLARQVLIRNQHLSWSLLENPGRLRIQTIDSLVHQIVSQMPLLTEFTPITEIADDVQWLYQLAIRNLFARKHLAEQLHEPLKILLLHLNNDATKLEMLLKAMLAKRDQWLEHIVRPRSREYLENALKKVNKKLILQCEKNFPKEYAQELLILMQFSAQYNSTLAICQWEAIPTSALKDKHQWIAISNFLLTKTFSFRETVNHSLGFPQEQLAKNPHEKILFKDMKVRFKSLIRSLKPFECFRASLENLIKAPELTYSKKQWEVLSALMLVLKQVIAELKIIFYEKKRVDFVEMLLAALNALGTEDQPTELGLILDYKIQHLLIDEFQDTSIVQFKLIERLISGWQDQDDRTIFLVGDPMQSIYRFRQAEVGLFLIAQKKGIGNVHLTPIQLEVNFRSEAGILDWINQQFSAIFPKQANVDLGAVSFYPSVTIKKTTQAKSIYTHTVHSDDERELCSLIKEKWQYDPSHRIAILVRSRSHLETIIPALLQADLNFHAIEIAALKEQPVICDLYALTRILLSPVDRLAWFIALRAPWCGLCLSDLHELVYRKKNQDFLSLLESIPDDLSEDGRKRFLFIGRAIQSAIALRSRERIASQVKNMWLLLNGPLCYSDAQSLQHAQNFFDLLANIEKEMGFVDIARLDARLNHLFSESAQADTRLQIMTIHKAKGLEFDSVIIPGIERRPKFDMPPILRWLEKINLEEQPDLLLAPIKEFSGEEDSIYQYLTEIEKNKQKHELVRLLYVAATRAKSCLHWFMNSTDNPAQSPPTGSLLSLLTTLNFEKSEENRYLNFKVNDSFKQQVTLRRLKSEYFPIEYLPKLPAYSEVITLERQAETFYEKLGTVIHILFDQMVRKRECGFDNELLWKKWLIQEGLLLEQIPIALQKIKQAFENVQKDPKGQWILDASHQDSHSELAITLKDLFQTIRIDRTFVDREGRRWVVDYKSNTPKEQQPLSDFLDAMKKQYYDQLQRYGNAISNLYGGPVFLGLYFPLVPAWCEWKF